MLTDHFTASNPIFKHKSELLKPNSSNNKLFLAYISTHEKALAGMRPSHYQA